ncbi:ccr4-not transcription complex subunit 10 [Nannochloropsis oceanica]
MSCDSKASVASQAHAFYSIGKYENALECLQRLVKMGGKEDSRVQGNLVLTEHAKGGFKRPLVVRDRITALRNSLKARSGKAGPVPAALRGKDSLRLDAEDVEDDEDDEEADDTDTDTSILLYNLAALHFHEKQYGASQNILYALFARIEVLEEGLAVHVCFLLLDVLIHSSRGNIHTNKDRERFSQNTAAPLAYLERPHVFCAPVALSSETEDSSTTTSSSGGGSASSSSGRSLEMAEFNFRLHLGGAAVEGGDSDDDEAAAAAASATAIAGNTLMGGVDASLPPAGMANVAALYLKANLEYLRQNYKKALKLLASCQGGEGGMEGGVTSAYYNDMGCLHFKTGLHFLALQYFQKSVASFNHPLSLTGTNGSSTSTSSLLPGGRPLEIDGRVLPHALCEVVYNTGLQLMLMGKPSQAFRCFENASLLFYNRPRVWLRMAECCVAAHREEGRRRNGAVRDRLVRRVVGQGRHRRVVLPVSNDPQDAAAAAAAAVDAGGRVMGGGEGGVRGQCTLAYAVKCLQNALFLLSIASQGGGRSRLPMTTLFGGAGSSKMTMSDEADSSSSSSSSSGGAGVQSTNGTAATISASAVAGAAARGLAVAAAPTAESLTAGSEGGPASPQEQDDAVVEQVALLTLSYVYLCLQEPVLALRSSEALLSRGPGWMSESKRVTAHTYAAEALCVLGQPEEALKHLLSSPGSTPLSEEAAVSALQEQRQSESKAVVMTADSFLPPEHFAAQARSALHLNLANVYLLQNNLAAAEECVRAGLAACPTSPDALRSLLFILLRTGNTTAALEALKSRRPLNLGGPASAAQQEG